MYTIKLAVDGLLNLISFLILIQCLMSWFPGGRESKAYDMMSVLTDPIQGPIRSVMYRYINGPIDFSPVIAILLINLARRFVWMIL